LGAPPQGGYPASCDSVSRRPPSAGRTAAAFASTASRIALTQYLAGQFDAMGASVLIVDDHPGFRAQARRMLESEGYRVVGEAGDAASALDAARDLGPELALVDVYLPDGDGFDVASWLGGLDPPPAVVLISSHDRAELAHCVAESGARGFVPKTELSREAIEELLR
jgi:CheY-like chemotaxis protein